jgi:hypothetical protein
MGGCGKQGEHPYYEEVVGYHGREFSETDRLDADASQDLLIGEGEKEFPRNGPRFGARGEFVDDDEGGEG